MSSSKYDGSVAPKERINIRYIPKTDGNNSEVELPLNVLIFGDTGKQDNTPLDERVAISVNKNNFNAVISEAGIGKDFSVPSALSDAPGERMHVALKVKSMRDLSPDNIAQQVPEIRKLLELREALIAVKGPMGNFPAFRAQIQALLSNEESREQLIKELGLVDKN